MHVRNGFGFHYLAASDSSAHLAACASSVTSPALSYGVLTGADAPAAPADDPAPVQESDTDTGTGTE